MQAPLDPIALAQAIYIDMVAAAGPSAWDFEPIAKRAFDAAEAFSAITKLRNEAGDI